MLAAQNGYSGRLTIPARAAADSARDRKVNEQICKGPRVKDERSEPAGFILDMG
jgi:hypothetical protein